MCRNLAFISLFFCLVSTGSEASNKIARSGSVSSFLMTAGSLSKRFSDLFSQAEQIEKEAEDRADLFNLIEKPKSYIAQEKERRAKIRTLRQELSSPSLANDKISPEDLEAELIESLVQSSGLEENCAEEKWGCLFLDLQEPTKLSPSPENQYKLEVPGVLRAGCTSSKAKEDPPPSNEPASEAAGAAVDEYEERAIWTPNRQGITACIHGKGCPVLKRLSENPENPSEDDLNHMSHVQHFLPFCSEGISCSALNEASNVHRYVMCHSAVGANSPVSPPSARMENTDRSSFWTVPQWKLDLIMKYWKGDLNLDELVEGLKKELNENGVFEEWEKYFIESLSKNKVTHPCHVELGSPLSWAEIASIMLYTDKKVCSRFMISHLKDAKNEPVELHRKWPVFLAVMGRAVRKLSDAERETFRKSAGLFYRGMNLDPASVVGEFWPRVISLTSVKEIALSFCPPGGVLLEVELPDTLFSADVSWISLHPLESERLCCGEKRSQYLGAVQGSAQELGARCNVIKLRPNSPLEPKDGEFLVQGRSHVSLGSNLGVIPVESFYMIIYSAENIDFDKTIDIVFDMGIGFGLPTIWQLELFRLQYGELIERLSLGRVWSNSNSGNLNHTWQMDFGTNSIVCVNTTNIVQDLLVFRMGDTLLDEVASSYSSSPALSASRSSSTAVLTPALPASGYSLSRGTGVLVSPTGQVFRLVLEGESFQSSNGVVNSQGTSAELPLVSALGPGQQPCPFEETGPREEENSGEVKKKAAK